MCETLFIGDVKRSGNGLVQFGAVARDKLKRNVDNDISTEATVYRILIQGNLRDVCLNVEIMIRMYLTVMISNYSLERSFPKLEMIKHNGHGSTVIHNRLAHLTLLCLKWNIASWIPPSQLLLDTSAANGRTS